MITMRKTGGWCVELMYPLKHQSGEIAAIEIRRPRADQVIRWRDGSYMSILAFLSELTGISERQLRQLDLEDFDRVIFAFMNCMPGSVKDDLAATTKPLATPEHYLEEKEPVPAADQIDPRFPAVDGPVVRFADVMPKPAPPPAEPPAMDFSPPSISEAVR